MTSSLATRLRDRVFRLTPFRMLTLSGRLGMVAIGDESLLVSQRAGEAEARSDVRALIQVVDVPAGSRT